MTIDEAIEHAEEKACGNGQCAKDHAQLADWLRELRRARMEIDLLKTLRDGFKADAQKYKAENAKLRDAVVALWKCCAWNANLCEWCAECDLHDTENGGCKLKRMLNELGIEVS